MRPKGWHNESARHGLAAKGVKTGFKNPALSVLGEMFGASAAQKKMSKLEEQAKKDEEEHGYVAGWSTKVMSAQQFPYVKDLKTGKKVKRVKYGDEPEDWGAGRGEPCHDCGVRKGQYHVSGCDVERSPFASEKGQQMLTSERAGDFFKDK